jgi:riboflavin synthase
MFTGIIAASSKITGVKKTSGGMLIFINTPKGWKVKVGDSITVNGVCSTAKKVGKKTEFFYMPETLAKSAAGSLKPGDMVNLEQSMRPSDRLDGHIVQGHVDTTGKIVKISRRGESYVLEVAPVLKDKSLMKLLAPKGSIAIDGISLTVVDVLKNSFTVNLIPYTWEVTDLHTKKVGDLVNLEFDVLAKYLKRLISK